MSRASESRRKRASAARRVAFTESPEKAAARRAALARGVATQAAARETIRLARLAAGESPADASTPRPPAGSRIPVQPKNGASAPSPNFAEKGRKPTVGEAVLGGERERKERTGGGGKSDGDDAEGAAKAAGEGQEGEAKIFVGKNEPDSASGAESAEPTEEAKKPEAPKVIYKRAPLYPMQFNSFYGPERWSWTEGTTKAGKTAGLIVWLSEQAIRGKPDQNFWWVAPVAPVAAIAYRRMCKAIPYNLRTTHDTLQRITLVNGAHIWFKSAEKPDNLYGEDVYAAAIDECSRVREESWHAVRTTLSATKGMCRGIGNVKGRRNWFYKMCRRAEAGASKDTAYHKLTWRDAVAAGILDVQEVEDARSQLPPAVFQELYEAEASDDTGCPFGLKAIKDCIRGLSTDPVTVWGWDFARKHDFCVGIGLDRLGRVADFERFQLPWEVAIPLIRSRTNRLPALVDSTGIGDVILAALAQGPGNFEGYTFTSRSKQSLMESLAIDIQTRSAQFPEGPISSELETFEYTTTRTGVVYAAPEGMFDDCVCSLALVRRHWTNGNGKGGSVPGGAGHARLPANERSAAERGSGTREILIG